jgi:hypothetical protein
MCTNGALSGSFTFNSCIIGINTAPVWLQVPSLSILRNAGYGSLNLQNYVFDAQAPPQILQFGIDYATMAARNPNPPFTCKIASGSSMLECFPNHGQDAKTTYYVYVTDGIETVTTPVEVTVGINMVPSREKNNDGLMIMQFIVPEFSEGELARGTLPISVGLKNDGSRLDDVIVKATVLEFGSSAKVGPFDLGAEAKNVQLYIPLDMSVRAGIYTVRLTITDTDTGLNRIEHRDLVVYPGR